MIAHGAPGEVIFAAGRLALETIEAMKAISLAWTTALPLIVKMQTRSDKPSVSSLDESTG